MDKTPPSANTPPAPGASGGAQPHPAQPSSPTAAGAAAAQPGRKLLTRQQHWHKTRRLSIILLLLWLATGFCAAFFARELAGLSVFGWPLSFYLAAQGASLVYLAILAFYAWRMRRLDQEPHA